MRNVLLSGLFLILSFVSFAQKGDTTYYQALPVVVSYLKPITIESGRYYYADKRLSSGGAGYALEIPFAELNDADVNRRFRNYKTARTAGQIVAVVPLFYFIYSANRGGISQNDYWAIYFASIGVSIVSDLIGKAQLRKGIEQYNLRVERNKFGFSAQPLPNQTYALGFGLSRSF
jgi:hypothetical protein